MVKLVFRFFSLLTILLRIHNKKSDKLELILNIYQMDSNLDETQNLSKSLVQGETESSNDSVIFDGHWFSLIESGKYY
jgi:hypothetical protein